MPNRKLTFLLPLLGLLAFVAILFFPALFGGKILAPLDITSGLLPPWSDAAGAAKPHNQSPSDAVTQYLPYRMFAEESLREDGYIGWNPYEMGGYNLAANTMALPGSWPMQLHRWLAFKDAWNLGIIGEFLIAGVGMLLFLRSRKLPWLPSMIGTVAFMFNAQFIIWIYHRWALGSFCWMPWALWAYGNGFAFRPIPRRAFLLPSFLALALLGGSLQHVAFVVLACACLAIADLDLRRPFARITPLVVWPIVLLLAFASSAFSLIPQLQGYLDNIAIGHVRGGIGYPDGVSQILLDIVLIPARIWPWLAGDPQSMDAWKLLKSDIMELNYIGTIPMLLGFAGLFVKGMPRQAKWLIAVGLLIPLTPLVGPLYHRVELLFILGAAWMAAEMVSQLVKNPKHSSQITSPEYSLQTNNSSSLSEPSSVRRKFLWRRALIITVSGIGFALLLGSLLPSSLRTRIEETTVSKAVAKSEQAQFGSDKEWIASRAREWTARFSITHPRTAWVYGLLVIGTGGLLLASRTTRRSQLTGQCLILAATSLELATLFQTWTTWSDPEDLRRNSPAIEQIRTLTGPHRILQYSPDASFAETFAVPNLLAAYGVQSVDSYESIKYRSSQFALRDQPKEIQLPLSGVGTAVHPRKKSPPLGTESWEIVPLSEKFLLRINPEVPATVTAGVSVRPTTPEEIFQTLREADTVISPAQSMNKRLLDFPANTRWLRISQNWHQGWKWRIPGETWNSFINGTDAACWIDPVPPNAQQLEVRFFPRPAWLMYFSLGAALLPLCLLLTYSHGIERAQFSN